MEKTCKGRILLYDQLFEDGLQRFLLIKCYYCHNVVAEFPASLPIGVTTGKFANNKAFRLLGQCYLKLSSLLAVHTTLQSKVNFQQTCSILDLKVPARDISKRQLKTSLTHPHVWYRSQWKFQRTMSILLPLQPVF